jgi:hypothetical protein
MTAYPYTKANAAFMISLIFFGMLFGGPILASVFAQSWQAKGIV